MDPDVPESYWRERAAQVAAESGARHRAALLKRLEPKGQAGPDREGRVQEVVLWLLVFAAGVILGMGWAQCRKESPASGIGPEPRRTGQFPSTPGQSSGRGGLPAGRRGFDAPVLGFGRVVRVPEGCSQWISPRSGSGRGSRCFGWAVVGSAGSAGVSPWAAGAGFLPSAAVLFHPIRS